MNNKKNALRGLTLKIFAGSLILGASGLALADQWGVQVAGGLGDHHVRKLDLGVVWDPNLTWWQIGDWHFALIGEAHVAWWHTDESDEHRDIGEFGVTPFIRFIRGTGSIRPFVEAGVGVRLLTHARISSDYTYATAFQFAPTAGAGVQFGSHQQYQAGYRFQHVSNGGIKEPNPGINFHQLYLQYNF
ncbi:lipid A 3-O-deacylase PagL [Paraburkholderia sp. BL6665CI2N2]|uniref:acyloxyacyl hydrolase n=1 Tax=Paraburkholderia sp. BL6665CI2N2 TaxID=1938806 RepID=UPI001065D9F6|nr:acyloxyacyl hydrolase [Paraburkholderia sp. BL6665CI2N2]TDY25137.1 lipid A 3-O-deacylase PagL [Paraburkholderia sp. BL6665CI2N2]